MSYAVKIAIGFAICVGGAASAFGQAGGVREPITGGGIGEEDHQAVLINLGDQERSLLLEDLAVLPRNVIDSLYVALPEIPGDDRGSLPARLAYARVAAATDGRSDQTQFFRKRIVGGDEARVGEFPWQAALALSGYPASGGQFCGGSIIDERHILTAAHCVEDLGTADFFIRVGSNSLSYIGDEVQHLEVEEIFSHEQYDSFSTRNDIAVVRLNGRIDLSKESVSAVMLPESGEPPYFMGEILTVSGWGDTTEGGVGTAILRKVSVPVIDYVSCNSPAFYSGAIESGMLCAGIGGKDTCQGDSGGPLVKGNTQVGVVSWGYGCARPNKPGVYSDVTYYRNWIDRQRQR